MKKIVKISFITFSIIIVLLFIALGLYLGGIWFKYSSIQLDTSKLTSPSLAIEVFDSNNRTIKDENMFNSNYVKESAIPKHVKEAFVSIEDKTFYQHNGVNYKRIAKAMVNNIKSMNLKEGASTISQQLIKNTHLTSEKTFNRKIKEVVLTKKLEKQFSKDEILEQYLNVIYFGNNCYGIEKASNFYFSKSAHDLSLVEGATLAGIIKSPAKYSPLTNPENSLNRRNLVLKEMQTDDKITLQEYMTAKEEPLTLNLNTKIQNKLNSYSETAIEEAMKILGLPAKQIALSGYQLHTYQNLEKQQQLEKAFEDADVGEDDYAGIVINNQKHAVEAYTGRSAYKIITARRQPGSCIKPILVYSPALNEDIINPSTQLLDEKTTISGYTPKNVGGKYNGYVSAREAVSRSINIPAVKVLSYVGIDRAKSYAQSMGITFDEGDDNYALALGGMCYGVNINQLASAYTTLANKGMFAENKFISYITDKNDKLVYVHRPDEKRVLREDCAYLMTDMLRTSAKTGTARKLSDLNIDIASKTGTVGKSGSKENLDAWNMSYTNAQTCGVWIGNLDNRPTKAVGGGLPTTIVKNYFINNKDESTFEQPSSIVSMPIDITELEENHKVVLANSFTPARYTKDEIFSRFNLPSEISNKFTQIKDPELKGKVVENTAILTLNAKDYYQYKIYKESINESNLVSTIEGKNGKQTIECELLKPRERFVLVTSFAGQITSSQTLTTHVDLIKSLNNHTNTDLSQKWYV